MSNPRMQTMRCTVHDLVFGVQSDKFDVLAHRCPQCRADEFEGMKQYAETVREHRDLLLRAFEIKRTVVLQQEGAQGG
jgi:hypothetical protein